MNHFTERGQPESRYAWVRLTTALLLMTIGGSGMYGVVVALPAIESEFAVARADASLPYMLTMIGFGIGGVLMGRLADRFGAMVPVLIGAASLGIGYIGAGLAPSLGTFSLAHGIFIGLLGCSATFAPLLADISLWFTRHRGIAVAICASGNYVAGAIWPPVMQYFFEQVGWRQTYIGVGLFSAASMLLFALVLRTRPPVPASDAPSPGKTPVRSARPLGLAPNALLALLSVAGVACCVAMSMPQVHIVAYCGDLGYGAARGAQMLSLMFGFGILSRLGFGWISDRIGGLRTLLLGSALQGTALALFLPSDQLITLYVVSALFGFFQGGLVPSYAIIVREHFNPAETGARVGFVLMATLFGMALGGWMSGALFDLTGSYRAAFLNGIAWNLLNMTIAVWLLRRARGRLERN